MTHQSSENAGPSLERDWPFAPCDQVAAAKTLVEVLAYRAATTPNRVGYIWLDGDGLADETALTYGQLYDQVCRVAARLSTKGEPGDRVVLLFDSGFDFLRMLLGCQAAGRVPVPVMPPRSPSPAEVARVMRILQDAAACAVVTTAQIALLASALPGAGAVDWFVCDALADIEPITPRAPAELALLQYTSGSTSAPKGVMVGHDNLMRNVAYIHWGENCGPETVSVSWLPMTHDMGLVEGIMKPLYSGHLVYLFHPARFLKRPIGWLEVIARTGADISGGPNFAYDLLLRRLGQGPLPRLDLSRWRFAYDGSEPVRADTIDAFCARMAPLGFQRQAFQALYGMAEATLGVTAGRLAGPRLQRRVGPHGATRVVSCGVTPDDMSVVVVDSVGATLTDGEEGEIWLNGPCIARGYWQQPQATETTFGARIEGSDLRFLRTGDLGFLLDGEVFVTGRIKELIICRGVNVHPQDLEVTAESAHPLVRAGGAVAFGVDQDGNEAVVLVAELQRKRSDEALAPVVAAIRSALARAHGVPTKQIALVPAGTIPRTTSGKRQRARVAKAWQRGKLPVLQVSKRTEPTEGLSNWLPARVASLLGTQVHDLDSSSTLPELGLSSLAIIELLSELETRFSGVSLGALLSQPLASLTGGEPTAVIESKLPDSFQVCTGELGDAILLTGATGFAGAAIALRLLATTEHPVLCLVRGEPGRVLRHLKAQPGWNPSWTERIEPIVGDLSVARLGLDPAAFHRLSARLGGIVHAAAMVNWVYPLIALAPTNIGGTRELLVLAGLRATPFVHLSTLACCWSLTATATVGGDTDPADHLDGIHLPYVRSKAIAESLVRQAATRGLPVSILRPGLIIGDSDTGRGSPGDFLSSLFKGCIELGAAPDLDWDLEVCPVDQVANAAVEALGSPGRTLHLESPERRPWRGVVLWMALRGHPLELLPYDAWCERVCNESSALSPLQSFFTRPVLDRLRVPELYERSRRNRIESPNPPTGAPLDPAFLERSFASLTAQGYLPGAGDPPPHSSREPNAAMLSQWLRRPVDSVRVVPWPDGSTSSSLIGELASWRYGRAAGVRRLELSAGTHTWTVVEKAQVEHTTALDIAQRVADLCSPDLAAAWRAHRPHSELVRSAERERALYDLDLPSPRCLGRGPSVLLLEDVSEFRCNWDAQSVRLAIEGLGRVHALDPDKASWLPPLRTCNTLSAQSALWAALAENALKGPFGGWLGARGRKRYEHLVTHISDWGAARDQLPQTFIHNDFSPRNATIKNRALCAWDWELAGIGLPQRDLAELLCFTSQADALPGALALHASTLEQEGIATDHQREAFIVALSELLVTRLSLYAMIDGFQRQSFLPGVVRTWVALDAAIRGAHA